jgi:hypothetical protein
MRLQGVTDTLGNLSLSNPHRVLIVGCAYGGISAAINLLEYSQGKARQSVYPGPDFQGARSRRGVEITVIDERDGYCASLYPTSRGTPSPLTPPRHLALRELLLTFVSYSPFGWRTPRPCHTKVHKPHVEEI